MNRNKILSTVFIAATCLGVSCSSDDKSLDITSNNYLSIPDPSFEALLIEQNIDSDGEINQQMLKRDTEEITNLNLSNLSHGKINDLTGIEGFLNLKKLTVTQHEIEQIDISANTLLDTLYLGGNYISTIDVSNNTSLILLDIQANELTSITGLSNLTYLKNLDLSWNSLEELNIQNETLEVLHVRDNELSIININEAVNLKNLLLTTNKLTSIDLSTNLLLETILISNNEMGSINLTNNIKLSHLHVLDNLLSSLDVSNNSNLVELKIARNPDLTCIKIQNEQSIASMSKSDYQELSVTCN